MGAKPKNTICAYCGKIEKRQPHDTSSFVKCKACQKKGNNKLLPLKQWQKRKMVWLRSLKEK